jgi:hypothetical protein
MDLDKFVPPHHLVKNKFNHIKMLTKEIEEMSKTSKEKIEKIRLATQEKLNKTRINKGLKVNDYVFVKDRTEIPGASRPLKTKMNPSPYVVLSVKYATVLIKRLSDGFISLYSMDDVKKYDKNSDLFADIPRKVGEVLLHDFTELLDNDFTTLMKYDPLNVPPETSVTKKYNEKLINVDENEDEKLAMEIKHEQIEKDLLELKNEINLKESVPLTDKLNSDSETESEEEPESWAERLRPRKGKVTFKGTKNKSK